MRLHNSALTEKAKQLRKNMTEQERKLWFCFLKKLPVTFYRQKVLGNYIVDFYCPSANLIVELDGAQHFEETNTDYEITRTIFFMDLGFTVLRYTNKDVNINFNNICEDIYRYLNI